MYEKDYEDEDDNDDMDQAYFRGSSLKIENHYWGDIRYIQAR